jgi:hypothetical protein
MALAKEPPTQISSVKKPSTLSAFQQFKQQMKSSTDKENGHTNDIFVQVVEPSTKPTTGTTSDPKTTSLCSSPPTQQFKLQKHEPKQTSMKKTPSLVRIDNNTPEWKKASIEQFLFKGTQIFDIL